MTERAPKYTSLIKAVPRLLSVRDVFIFGGLAILWYGLEMLAPWLAYAVIGCLLFTIGVFSPWLR